VFDLLDFFLLFFYLILNGELIISEVFHIDLESLVFEFFHIEFVQKIVQLKMLHNYSVHGQTSFVYPLLAQAVSSSVVLKNAFKRFYISADRVRLDRAQDNDIVASFEIDNKIFDDLLHYVIHKWQYSIGLVLIVPDHVGCFQLQEDIFINKMNSGVKVTMVNAILGEVVNDVADNIQKGCYLH
jgi:hypothetical protein